MQKKHILFLKSLAVNLKPTVMLGKNGLTDNVIDEIKSTIENKELIKVKLSGTKEEQVLIIQQIESSVHAECVQHIGHIGVFYKAAKQPIIVLKD